MPRLEPNPRHVLFFPNRKKVFEDAIDISFWSREDYKHVQVEDFVFTIQLGGKTASGTGGQAYPAAKTKDNLRCNVLSICRLRVNTDPDSLAKSTKGHSASRNPKVIGSAFFEQQLRTQVESLIERCIGEVDYIDLLTKPHSKNELEATIEQKARIVARDSGFELVGCRVDVELSEPMPEALTDDLQEAWAAHLQRRSRLEEIKRNEDVQTELRKLEQEQRSNERKKELQAQNDKAENKYEIERRQELEKRDEELDKIATAAKEREKHVKEEQAKISAAIRAIDEEVQNQVAIAESNLRRLREDLKRKDEKDAAEALYAVETEAYRRRAELMQLKREESARERENAEASLRHEQLLGELKLQQASTARSLVELEQHRILTLGKAEAETNHSRMLAARAGELELQRQLLEKLPTILREAYSPASALSDVKCVYIGQVGSEGVGTGSSGNGLGSVLASMSTIPLLREIMKFIGEWPSGDKTEVSAEPAAMQATASAGGLS